MLVAEMVQKTRLFQPALKMSDNTVYITNTKHGKKKFIKRNIDNVVFREDISRDEILGRYVTPMKSFNRKLLLKYTEEMFLNLTRVLKLSIPVDEILISSDNYEEILAGVYKYARLITIATGEDGWENADGIPVRRVKKIKNPPSVIIEEKDVRLSPLLKIPKVDLREKCEIAPWVQTRKTLSFQTDVLPFEIGIDSLAYLIDMDKKAHYKISSFKRKTPQLFVFKAN